MSHRMKALYLLLAIVLACGVRAAEIEPDRMVVYKVVGEVELRLHVFEPVGLKATEKRTAVVFFFGGGWSGGDPKQFYQQARYLADRGFVAFSAEYRVKSRNQTTPFECVKDGKSAVRWIRQNAGEMGIDSNRIVAAGGSAGGHVAACAGVIQGREEEGEDVQISSVPDAMILLNPVLDTTERGAGAVLFEPGERTALSPCHHVRPGQPPTIVFHGTKDRSVPFENAERFTRLMNEVKNTCVLVPFEGRGHGFFNSPMFQRRANVADYELVMKRCSEFLESTFPKQEVQKETK